MQTLRAQLSSLQRSHSAAEQEVQRMRAAVQLREQELGRASRMLAGTTLVGPFSGRQLRSPNPLDTALTWRCVLPACPRGRSP